jgi:hypothetical protein
MGTVLRGEGRFFAEENRPHLSSHAHAIISNVQIISYLRPGASGVNERADQFILLRRR